MAKNEKKNNIIDCVQYSISELNNVQSLEELKLQNAFIRGQLQTIICIGLITKKERDIILGDWLSTYRSNTNRLLEKHNEAVTNDYIRWMDNE